MASEAPSSSRASSPIFDDDNQFNFQAFFIKKTQSGPPSSRRKGRQSYRCLHCDWENIYKGNCKHHALTQHRRLIQQLRYSSSQSSQGTSVDSFIQPRSSTTTLRNVFNRQHYIEAIVSLLTRRRVSFSAVDWDELKELALACNPAIEDCLITSRRTVMRHIAANFTLYSVQLAENLQAAISKIHISTDLWTSPHRHGVLAVCAQWVDKDYQLRKALLGLPEVRHAHNGENQATAITTILDKFEISNIGYHTGDNATSNNTCLEHLARALKAKHNVGYTVFEYY
jgi:hypothetical protein